jgi:hypothetical protein
MHTLAVTGLRPDIGDLNNGFRCNEAGEWKARVPGCVGKRMLPDRLGPCRGSARQRVMPEPVSLGQQQVAELGIANARAFARSDSKTGCSSPGELEMTLSTSEVAVCCCSDSRSSLSRRVFSMAMTACRAKFLTSSICLSPNGRTFIR